MAEQPNQIAQTRLEKGNDPEVYSVSQDKDGSLHFSRREFLTFGMAVAGTLLVKGVCPRFGAGTASTKSQTVQAGMMPLPRVSLHTGPRIDSDILDTLQPNDLVLLVADHPEVGWVEVATRAGKQGWLQRTFVDFSHPITSSSLNFKLSSAISQNFSPRSLSAQLIHRSALERKVSSSANALSCGDAIQNGGFEGGHTSWAEESNQGTNALIRNSWPSPFQGSFVALLGGVNYATDKLTQLIHLPADIQDIQLFEFYLEMTTEETSTGIYDWLVFRLLDAGGTPISNDVQIADNTAPVTDWTNLGVEISGLSGFAGMDIQIQFEGHTDVTLLTSFVIDAVSFNLTCGNITPTPTDIPTSTPVGLFVYLPIVMNGFNPIPTNTPTKTPTPTATSTPGPCSCDSFPCTCNAYPCTCNALPCSCNAFPCVCNIAPCTCNSLPCSCNAYPNPCTCNAFPCACNIAPCSCNAYPNPCTCNAFPCAIT